MRLADKIIFLAAALFIYLLIHSSCANPGMPTGGLKDTIPPSLVETSPLYKSVGFKGKEVRLTFSEYIVPEKITDLLVVSPPLQKRPVIRTKSKTLIVGFNEPLKDSVTYSLDFKDAIIDNNERNPLNDLRFMFSTGTQLDTFRIAGMVKNSFDLTPIENALVMMYKNLHDSAVYRVKPNYIARTNKNGIYYFDNLAPGRYHLFSIGDNNTNLLYDEGSEEIAFVDSVIIPSAEYHQELDTLAKGTDSLLITGHTHFRPDPFYLLQFRENIFEQYLRNAKRLSRQQLVVVFNESVADTLAINLLGKKRDNWYVMEHNPEKDSLLLWLTDSLLIKQDTIKAELVYHQLDSLKNIYLARDTVNFTFTGAKPDEESRGRRRPREEKKEIPQFDLEVNLSSTTIDITDTLLFMARDPLKAFDPGKIRLYQLIDTLKKPQKFTLVKDTSSLRNYRLLYRWELGNKYRLEVDSAAVTDIYGLPNRKFKRDFSTQKDDYYGQIVLDLRDVESQVLIQLVENTDQEKVLRQFITGKNGVVKFDFLKPEKYRVKFIFDRNSNGKWDTGSYQDKYQPEKVAYLQEVIKVRSNWESNYPSLSLKENRTYPKVLYDKEVEEQKKKDMEKRRQEEEKRRNKAETGEYEGGNRMGGGIGLPTRMGQ